MVMRKFIALFLGFQLVFATEVVTDPISYTYFVEQINQVTTLIKNAQEQVKTLGGVKTAIDDVKRQVYTVQDAVMGAMEDFASASQGLFDEINNMDETTDQIFSMDRDSISTVQGDQSGIFYRSTAELIDDFFVATGTMPIAEFLELNDEKLRKNVKKDMAQYAWQRLIKDQDKFAERRKEQQERTAKVFEEIKKSTDMVNMQKSTAALLQELIMIQTEMLQLQKYAIVAYAYGQYKGVDLNKLQTNVKLYNDTDPQRRQKAYEDRQKSYNQGFKKLPRASDEDISRYTEGW